MNITEHINMHYVWGGLIAWALLVIVAVFFIRGASPRLDDSQPTTQLEAQ